MNYYLILLPIALLLAVSKILMKLCEKVGLPTVIGMLLAGVVVGLINYIPGQTILNDTVRTGLGFFSQIGVILLMFSAGLETDLNEIKRIGLPAVAITFAGVILPMTLGFVIAVLCDGGFADLTRDKILTDIFYGAISTATSVSITVATLREIGKLNTKVGNTIVAAAILDDILGIVVLSVVLAMKGDGITVNENPWKIATDLVLFFIAVAMLALIVPRLFKKLDEKYQHHRLVPIFSLSLCFIVAYASEQFFGIADITGAYIVGLLLSTNPDSKYIDRKSDILSYMIFVPIFFGNIGLSTQFTGINRAMLLFGSLFIIAGMLGKLLGCGATALLFHYKPRDAYKVGVGMMARAEVALVTAQKGIEYNIIDSSIMPFIVLLIIITSFVTPVLLQISYRKDKELQMLKDYEKTQINKI